MFNLWAGASCLTGTQVRILQQMTQWVMVRPERVREKMEEQKDIDQTSWVSTRVFFCYALVL